MSQALFTVVVPTHNRPLLVQGNHHAHEATETLYQRYKSPNFSIESARKKLFQTI